MRATVRARLSTNQNQNLGDAPVKADENCKSTVQDAPPLPKGKFVNLIVPMKVRRDVAWNVPLNGNGPTRIPPGKDCLVAVPVQLVLPPVGIGGRWKKIVSGNPCASRLLVLIKVGLAPDPAVNSS